MYKAVRCSLSRAVAIAVLASAAWFADGSMQVASANTMELTYEGMGPRRFVTYTFNSSTHTVRGGQFLWAGNVRTFCTQLEEDLSIGSTVEYEIVPVELVPDEPPSPGPMGINRAILVKDLYARWYETVLSKTGLEARNYAAAFQMNIWELTHQDVDDSTPDSTLSGMSLALGNATFSSNAGVDALANMMLGSLGGGVSDFLGFQRLRGLTSPTRQDQLLVVPGVGGLAACLGLAGMRRRRRR
ncbi:MAG: hypothetical protein MK085_01825 [Phycisphaerales bacterium]|nr:hypothetical protein [Phycisphaerales bacterium]